MINLSNDICIGEIDPKPCPKCETPLDLELVIKPITWEIGLKCEMCGYWEICQEITDTYRKLMGIEA